MKYILSFLLLVILTLKLNAQASFTIHGHIRGLEDGVVMRLFRIEGSLGSEIAADTIRQEHFQLQGEVSGIQWKRFP